eukprot:g38776.t1
MWRLSAWRTSAIMLAAASYALWLLYRHYARRRSQPILPRPLSPKRTSKARPDGVFRMVALDMDGTLLNAQHEITPRTRDMLVELSQRGVIIALCTGRSTKALYKYVEHLSLPVPLPVVCFNGAAGLRCHPGKPAEQFEPLFSTPVPHQTTLAVLAFSRSRELAVQYYVGDKIYVHCTTDFHRDFVKRYQELTGVNHVMLEDGYELALADSLPSKLLVMTSEPDQVLSELQGHLSRQDSHFSEHAYLVRGSPPFFVEVLHPRVHKGSGLSQLCDLLDIPLHEVVALGDGDNDVEFLELAGLGLAMKNARPEVQAKADAVTEKCHDTEGVAHELEKLLKQGRFKVTSI